MFGSATTLRSLSSPSILWSMKFTSPWFLHFRKGLHDNSDAGELPIKMGHFPRIQTSVIVHFYGNLCCGWISMVVMVKCYSHQKHFFRSFLTRLLVCGRMRADFGTGVGTSYSASSTSRMFWNLPSCTRKSCSTLERYNHHKSDINIWSSYLTHPTWRR